MCCALFHICGCSPILCLLMCLAYSTLLARGPSSCCCTTALPSLLWLSNTCEQARSSWVKMSCECLWQMRPESGWHGVPVAQCAAGMVNFVLTGGILVWHVCCWHGHTSSQCASSVAKSAWRRELACCR